ncbi:E3 ubiquitin-protein ligase RNF216-like [Physella acuta]|uniref:E3 ubiquitin-protein ligase RNF216-like n=1 Tax=Physella acuta TaxID=109671 RepID=UPI0027DC6EDB|nr:E3 ubiquitin-protein ligase RNF216-like [Physella acuta]
MTTIYIQHALAFLNEKFRHFSSGFISRKLNKHNNHLVPTYRELAKFNPSAFDRVKSIFLGTPNRTDVFDPPAKMDKAFFMERFYIENELCILNLIADLEITREIEISQAVENQSVQVCSKCSQHCLIKDSICCAGGHIICRICMDNYMAASVHNSMTRLVCQSPGCNNTIPVVKFKLLGTSKLYKTLERLVLKANLQGLVGCPVCFYLTEEINCSSKRFSCQNPDCLRDSCMDCKKMWHEPFKCGVVFQATQTSSTSISSGE